MNFFQDKTALITGATSGIGYALANQLAAKGLGKLILLGRRKERLENLSKKLLVEFGKDKIQIFCIELDIRDKEKIELALNNLPSEFKNINILINNAGLALSSDPIQKGNPDDWDIVIDTNLKGLLYMTHAVLPGLVERNSGHIVNISSVAGHEVYPGGNIYCATKHAVRALSKSLRVDLLGTNIRVTDIAPGAVQTEFSEVRWKDKAKSDNFYAQFDPLKPEDIADAIVYALSCPAHVNIAEIVLYPTQQASTNHLYKPRMI